MKVLIADDDSDLLELTTYALRRGGYEVVSASDGQQALRRVETEHPDIVLLDVNMPNLDGFEVCRRIRQDSETPVIMLTARHEEEDVVRGLKLGADDYVTKPFSAKQLLARMESVLRRARGDRYQEPARKVRIGDITVDLHSHEVSRGDRMVQLTPLEFRILYLLALNAGQVIPHGRLVEYVWGYDSGDSNLLKSHVCHIRQKLDLPPNGQGGIRAIPGVGYRLTPPETAAVSS